MNEMSIKYSIIINRNFDEKLMRNCVLAMSVRYQQLRLAIVDSNDGKKLIARERVENNDLDFLIVTNEYDEISIENDDFPLFKILIELYDDSFMFSFIPHPIIECDFDIKKNILEEFLDIYMNDGKNYWIESDFPLVRFTKRQIEQCDINIENIIPLSYKQRSLLSKCLVEKNKHLYVKLNHITFICDDFDFDKFSCAFDYVVDENEILRSVYKGRLQYQVIIRNMKGVLDYYDISYLPEKEKFDQLNTFSQLMLDEGFDYLNESLLKCRVIKLGNDKYDFITFHHFSIMDGFSYRVFVDSVFKYYLDLKKGVQTEHKSRSYYFKDYVIEEKEAVDNSVIRGFWKGKTASIKRIDFEEIKEEAISDKTITNYFEYFDCDESQDIKHKIDKFDKPRSLIFLASYYILCNKVFSESDLAIGVVSNTWHHRDDNTLGYFSNVLPYRIDFSKIEDERMLIDQLFGMMIECKQYEIYPIEDVCDICFTYENSNSKFSHVDEKEIEFCDSLINTEGTSNHGLYLSIKEYPDEFFVSVESKPFLFTRDKMQQMIKEYKNILLEMIKYI